MLLSTNRHFSIFTATALLSLTFCSSFSATFTAAQTVPSRQGAPRNRIQRNQISKNLLDKILLTNGKQLLGIISGIDQNQTVTLLVEREWLVKTHPSLHARSLKTEKVLWEQFVITTTDRIEIWQKKVKEDAEKVDLEFYLGKRLDEIKDNKQPTKLIFSTLKLKKNEINRMVRSSPAAKRLAGIAWSSGLKDITKLNPKKIIQKLKAKNIDMATATFDLSDQAIPTPFSELQWQAKQAVLRSEFLERYTYQKAGEKFIGSGEELNFLEMIQLAGSQNLSIENALGDLARDLPEFRHLIDKKKKEAKSQDWWKGVRSTAEQKWKKTENLTLPTAAYIKRQVPSSSMSSATIQAVLVVRFPDGKWNVVRRFQATANEHDIDAGQIDNLKDDENLKNILSIAQQFGAKNKVDQALKFGAMVQSASKKCDSAFHNYCQKQVDRFQLSPDR